MATKKRMSKKAMVLRYMKTHKFITDEKGYELCKAHRMGSIIFDLREEGHEIETEMVYARDQYGNPCRYGRYYLKKVAQ